MRAMRKKASFARFLALLAVLALVAAACTGGGGADTTTATEEPPATGETTPETTPDDTGDTTPDTAPDTTDGAPSAGGTFTAGIFENMTTDNLWNNLDQGNSVWNSYVLGPTTDSPYDIVYPGIEVVPNLAEGELQPTVQEGDVWVGEFTLREDAVWSDGEPITADDVVFTFETARDFNLSVNWPDYLNLDVTESVEAADERTVRVTFNIEPGLRLWGLGNGIPLMPIMPEHFWGPVVEEAAGTEDPRQTLLAASGVGAPAAGPSIFAEWQEGSFAAASGNQDYTLSGEEVTSGDVTYQVGPFVDEMQYPYYAGQDQAVLALANGEVDLLLNPLGMQQGLREQVEQNTDLTAIVNPTNGYRFLAFNHSRAPMDDAAFRDALAMLINKEFVTQQLLQGVAFPLYVLLPEGNTAWYNEEVANEIGAANGEGMEDDARRAEAIRILTEGGYGWETEPGWVDADGNVSPEPAEGASFRAGVGITDPDGNPIEQLELVHPTASYDPLRATFGGYIAGVAQEMGIPVVSVPTDFNKIITDHYTPDSEGNYPLEYDMHILGYSLGNAAFPTFHEAFFTTGAGSNNMGYSNPELDELADQMASTLSVDEAYEILWQMERIIAEDKPHLPLFDTGILEFYNNTVEFPFTETLSGLQFLHQDNLPGLVQTR